MACQPSRKVAIHDSGTTARKERLMARSTLARSTLLASAAGLALAASAPAWSAELSAANQNKLMSSIDASAPHMSEVALKIWNAPELGYQETQTTALLQDE